MAEFLIALRDLGDPADPKTQQAGDCISYKSNGSAWGLLEHKPTFDAWQLTLDPKVPEDAEHIGEWHGRTGVLKVPDMPLHRANRVVGKRRRVYKSWLTSAGSDDVNAKTVTRKVDRVEGRDAVVKSSHVKLINRETGALSARLPIGDNRVLLGEGALLFSDDNDIVDDLDEALIDWEREEEIVAHRVWSVDLGLLTKAQLEALQVAGELTVTTEIAAVFLKSKLTGDGVDRA